jgi:hypothetical protein
MDCVKDPGEPVATIVTEYVPAVVELSAQDDGTVALAERATATEGHVTVRPAGKEVPVKVTLPEKLLMLEICTVISPAAPKLKSTGVFADILKEPTLLAKKVWLCVIPPLVATIWTR